MIKNQWPSQSTKNDVCPSFLVSRSSNLQLSDRLKVRRKLRNAEVIADLNKFERRPHRNLRRLTPQANTLRFFCQAVHFCNRSAIDANIRF